MTGRDTGLAAPPRVLVWVTTRRDADITQGLFRAVGAESCTVRSLNELARELRRGADALLATEEVAKLGGIDPLVSLLHPDEESPDLPTVLLTKGGSASSLASGLLARLQNLTILERPAPISSIISAVQAAIRATRRQRDLLAQMDRIRELQRAAERANRLKDEFLATLGHELRTPLNAITGWVEVLRLDAGDPQAFDEGLQVIERNVRAQAQLIDDLLDVSRIASGKVRLNLKAIPLEPVLEAALETVRPAAQAKGVRLALSPLAAAPPVLGDPARLRQVVWNLLTNAIKFTPPGGHVHLRLARRDGGLEVSVTDTGEGITAEFLPHVFERFRQADGSESRPHGGLGLGLSIVKNLVEMHGGAVRAESAGPGRGATFSFRIPLQEAWAAPAEPGGETPRPAPLSLTARPDLSGLRILVIDDEADSRGMMRRLLESCGAQAGEAAQAQAALQLALDFQPDLILSDIGMPDLDGYQFIREARHKGIAAPAVAVTAFARGDDRMKALQAGFQAHLAKPIEPAALFALVAGLTGRLTRAY